MNTPSIPMVAMAGISLYVGFYHLLIYFRHRQNRTDLTFALLCFAYVLYAVFSAGLYNAVSVVEGAQWQRAQFIALGVFAPAFLWFVSDYTRQKPGAATYLFSIFYLLAIIVQSLDRSDLTFLVDQPSIKHITLPYIRPITYYEATLGPFSIAQGLMGVVVSTYILSIGIRYFQRGHKREAMPLILANILMYAAGLHDTFVSNNVYNFIYLIEYAYLAIIIVMAYSLSSTAVEAAIAKEKLRKSEERFRALVETTSDWVWEVDANGVYTYASPKVRDLLGYEVEEIIGRTPFDLMPEDEAERINAVFESLLLQKKPIERLENIARCKDGQLIVLETSGVPFFDHYGRLLGYRGIDRDITERKRAEQALRESEQKFRLFVEQSSDGFVFTDEQGLILEWNQAQESLTGLLRQESIGRPLWDVVHSLLPVPRQVPGVVEGMKQMTLLALQSGQADFLDEPMEVELFHRDGTKVIIQQTTFAIKAKQGYRLGLISRDITELKQVEVELRASEERYRRLVEVSPIPMWIDKDGIITYINPAGLQVLGATYRKQIVGKAILDFVHPDYHAVVKERVSQMTGKEKIAPLLEEKYIRVDGSIIDVEVIATPFSTSAGLVRQVLFQDITKRKLNEAEREALIASLEAKNAELERFTYTVSHDLKAPLITIRGFLGYIEQDARSGDMTRLKGDTQRIIDASEKMHRLLNELLELSRIGRLMNPSQNIAFGDLIQDVIKLMEGRLQERNVEVKIQDSLPVLFGDCQRLLEVIQNLLDNAVKFMGEQTKPVIEIGTKGEENGMPVLYVRDNGMGIAPEHHERIFGLFNKLNPSAEGTGAGLSIVKRIIEMHGGRIWVESEEGKGATFYFTLGKGTQGPESKATSPTKV